MTKKLLQLISMVSVSACICAAAELPKQVEFTKAQLYDKIKGGWAGQIIGCSYGGPTEFKFKFE